MSPQYLIGFDIETTGLNPHADALLEVHAEVWEADLEAEAPWDSFSAVIRPEGDLPPMSQYVRDMHHRTGLLDALPLGIALHDALGSLEELFREYPGAMLFGRNVGTFDRHFVEVLRPGITRGLSHRHLDVSTMLCMHGLWGSGFTPPELEGTPHRAEADVKHDLATLRALRDWYAR